MREFPGLVQHPLAGSLFTRPAIHPGAGQRLSLGSRQGRDAQGRQCARNPRVSLLHAFERRRLGFADDKDLTGLDARQDYVEAAKWWRKAAEQGDVNAQYFLAHMYMSGRGVPQDFGEAAQRFRPLAEQGISNAQYFLGIMYLDGRGVLQDDVMAHMWFNIAATLGTKEAVGMRNSVAENLTPEQIAEAQRLAREWMAAFEKVPK